MFNLLNNKQMKTKYVPLIVLAMALASASLTAKSAELSINSNYSFSISSYAKRGWGKEDIKNLVKLIIEDITGIPVDRIHDESILMQDLGMDSLDMLQLVLYLEDVFAIQIDEAHFLVNSSKVTVAELVDDLMIIIDGKH